MGNGRLGDAIISQVSSQRPGGEAGIIKSQWGTAGEAGTKWQDQATWPTPQMNPPADSQTHPRTAFSLVVLGSNTMTDNHYLTSSWWVASIQPDPSSWTPILHEDIFLYLRRKPQFLIEVLCLSLYRGILSPGVCYSHPSFSCPLPYWGGTSVPKKASVLLCVALCGDVGSRMSVHKLRLAEDAAFSEKAR